MKKSFKFINLVVLFVCISMFLTSSIEFGRSLSGFRIFTSNIHTQSYEIEDEYYKSRAFDDDFLPRIMNTMNHSFLMKDNDKEEKAWLESQLKQIQYLNFYAIDKDTDNIHTNTKSKSIEEFKNINKNPECYIEIISRNGDINYTKITNGKQYDKQIERTSYLGSSTLENGEIYISIPKDFTYSEKFNEKSYENKSYYEGHYRHYEISKNVMMYSFALSIVLLIIYKINKTELFDKNSIWLKLSKIIPIEVYLITLVLTILVTTNYFSSTNDPYYSYFMHRCIMMFLGIGLVMTLIYILNKQMTSYDNKRDILKQTFIYKVFNIVNILKNRISKLTRSMPLARRIIVLGVMCIGIIILGLFIDLVLWSRGLIVLVSSILSICIFTYYVLKKLDYISYIIDATTRIKDGEMDYVLELRDNDNFTILADNINNMRDGLGKAINNQLKSERMKSELITNVSHDLKTPLTSIINYVELIKNEDDISPEYIREYVEVLDVKSKRLKVLIEDLFEASRASTGNIELRMEKIDFVQLLEQSIGELDEKLSEANLNLKIRIPEDKVYIQADGRRLYRVLENILSNVAKYSLINTRVYIDMIRIDSKVILTMKNISSYEMNFDTDEIMERFKRADDSRNTEGSGLGLAIARDLVSIQGGKFNIDIDGDLFKTTIEFDELL